MKKTFLKVLLTAVGVISLSACSQSQTTASSSAKNTAAPKAAKKSNTEFAPQATITETVLYDENNVKITAKQLTANASELDLSLQLENNTDQNIEVISGSIGYSQNAINNYMVPGYLNVDITAGSKANKIMKFDADELMILGITEIGKIDVAFQVDNDDYDTLFKTGPCELKTSMYDSVNLKEDTYQKEIQKGYTIPGTEYAWSYAEKKDLFEQDGVKLIHEAVAEKKNGIPMLLLEFESANSDTREIGCGSLSLNGLVVSTSDWDVNSINPGARKVVAVDYTDLVSEQLLNQLGMKKIGKAGVDISLEDEDNNNLGAAQTIEITYGKDLTYTSSGKELLNQNGFTVTCPGITDQTSDSLYPIEALFVIRNDSNTAVYASEDYNSSSVNGTMIDASSYGVHLNPGTYGLLKLKMSEDDLKENGISKAADITSFSFTLHCTDDDYNDLVNSAVEYKKE